MTNERNEGTMLVRAGQTPAERCRYVADLIEAHPENFDMREFFSGTLRNQERVRHGGASPVGCGTTCCVAGWAVAVTPVDERPRPDRLSSDSFNADELLALNGFGNVCAIHGKGCLDIDDECIDAGLFYDTDLTAPDAAYLLRVHANTLDSATPAPVVPHG